MRIVDIKWDGWNSPFPAPKEIQVPYEIMPNRLDRWLEKEYGESYLAHNGYDLAPDSHIRELDIPECMPRFGLEWHAYRLTSWNDAVDVCKVLYWDFEPEMIKALDKSDASPKYPCIALFYVNDDMEGACAGTPKQLSVAMKHTNAALHEQFHTSEGNE